MIGWGRSRGASRTLQFMMLTGMVVMLSAVPSVYFLGFDPGPEPVPVVAGSEVDVTDADGPTIELSFTSGDTLGLEHLEILVEAECRTGTKSARLTSLPVGDPDTIPDSAYSGDAILDEHSRLDSGEWIAGSPLELELDADGCVLDSGSTARVEVVYRPSNAIVFRDADSL